MVAIHIGEASIRRGLLKFQKGSIAGLPDLAVLKRPNQCLMFFASRLNEIGKRGRGADQPGGRAHLHLELSALAVRHPSYVECGQDASNRDEECLLAEEPAWTDAAPKAKDMIRRVRLVAGR